MQFLYKTEVKKVTTTTKEPLISIPQPVITLQAQSPADKTTPHPIHKIVFLSSQERLKQGRQISAPENHLVLQQQCKAKGHMILVQQSGIYCFCSHSSYTFIPRILSLQTTAQALSVPTPKLSVISCLLRATG